MYAAQRALDLGGRPTAGAVLERIRKTSRDESEKGRWFEQLFCRIARQQPEFDVEEIWRWRDWPEREELTGRDGRDIGIDLVARLTSGEWVAIQCKCYDEKQTLRKGEIDKFLGGSQPKVFSLRWIVATCRWGPNAEQAIEGANPQVRQIDFQQYLGVPVEEEDAERPVQEPWPLQADAIEDVVEGLANHDRGRLIMACGTGKTFTSLRIAEQVVPDGGRILFAAPTIALVSQARREWLRQTTRKLACMVVCSDQTAGGRSENEDIRVSELECRVSTDASEIARLLKRGDDTRVVFCTYQSLRRVTEAQAEHGAPKFDLAIADEAHRTTGAVLEDGAEQGARKVDFRAFHDGARLHAKKRLYMTATPRIYTQSSRARLKDRGVDVIDMSDQSVYGPEFHLLPFKKAVENGMLSDYRVIVLGVSQAGVTSGLRRRLEGIEGAGTGNRAPTPNDMARVLGVSLAVNGVTEGENLEQPGRLPRTMAFSNTILRSKWYAKALVESEVLRATTRRMEGGRAMKVTATHLDASASALQRNQELRALAQTDREGECRIVCNVKLFTEGVDVPSLDAVVFLDPRSSQVDVVQAVGRVMRKAEGKRFGYIIVPVVVEPGSDVAAALMQGTEGYQAVGRVLRALQSHDGRLAESQATFVKVYESSGNGTAPGPVNGGTNPAGYQALLELKEAEQVIYAQVAAASGLGRRGQLVADEIADAVKRAGAALQEEALEGRLANALDMTPEEGGGAKGVCTVAALMLCNACLMQRRLRDEPEMRAIIRLDKVAGSSNPREFLALAWEAILEKDYAPVFRPALRVLADLPDGRAVNDAIRGLAECANRVADSLSELGYDHAGPLYHRILGSAKSDGAFYTNNISAIMLARLALGESFTDWSDDKAVAKLRVIDPACGTGTLLMAALRTIMARIEETKVGEDGDGLDEQSRNALHKLLVEDVLCGLDINQHAVQLAACNLTLGAPTVDYKRMNLLTMPHGPQGEGAFRAGSLELLNTEAERIDIHLVNAERHRRSLGDFDAEQVNESEESRFPLRDIDAVIMNAPFTDNRKRGRKFSAEAVRGMQQNEIEIRDRLAVADAAAGRVITTNSVQTFFTPLADQLLRSDRGALAMVVPVTSCTGTAGMEQRRFIAERFHVERIVTTHDPKRINFSENTSIHECLLICRRLPEGERPPTQFVSLRRMPENVEQAIEAADAIASGANSEWGTVQEWPAERVRAGDWTPAQWYDGALAEVARTLEANKRLEPVGLRFDVGPAGQRILDAYSVCDAQVEDAVPGFHSASSKLRRTMAGEPDVWYRPRPGKRDLADRYAAQRGHLLVTMRFDTVSGRLAAVWSDVPSFGWHVPIAVPDEDNQKALAAWWNATPVRLMLLNRRAKKLTYPMWQLAHLREIRIPKPDNPAWKFLRAAFDEMCETELLPMKDAETCEARKVIDAAAAKALGIKPEVVADWRRRLAAEPTITNQRADTPLDAS